MHNHRLDILMAVFNGGDYVAKQLDSIFEQTYQNWRLLVRDDGSSDGTVILLNQFINVHPDKIKLISTDNPNLGAFRNFSELISHSKADYIMFCDQDDVWLPRKIEISFQRMEELESSFGKDTPLLVH